MPFYRINKPGEPRVIAHVCMSKPPAPCVFADIDNAKERCRRMGSFLCDGPAGEDLGGKPLTCDAPMCEHHRTNVGPDKDLCPRCVKKGAAPRG